MHRNCKHPWYWNSVVIKNRCKIPVITLILKYRLVYTCSGTKFVQGFRDIHEIKVCTNLAFLYRLSKYMYIMYCYRILIKTMQTISFLLVFSIIYFMFRALVIHIFVYIMKTYNMYHTSMQNFDFFELIIDKN